MAGLRERAQSRRSVRQRLLGAGLAVAPRTGNRSHLRLGAKRPETADSKKCLLAARWQAGRTIGRGWPASRRCGGGSVQVWPGCQFRLACGPPPPHTPPGAPTVSGQDLCPRALSRFSIGLGTDHWHHPARVRQITPQPTCHGARLSSPPPSVASDHPAGLMAGTARQSAFVLGARGFW
jgi:hypothetical protein